MRLPELHEPELSPLAKILKRAFLKWAGTGYLGAHLPETWNAVAAAAPSPLCQVYLGGYQPIPIQCALPADLPHKQHAGVSSTGELVVWPGVAIDGMAADASLMGGGK